MRRSRKTALVAATLAGGLLLAACGSDDDDGGASATTAGATTTAAGGATTAGGTDTTAAGGDAVALAGVCPDNIVIQTDWFPEAEHGALYQMVGDNPTIDASKKVVKGRLVAGGQDTGVTIEIRTGGPAIGYQQVVAQMKQDPNILLGYVATDEAIENYADTPTMAIVAPLEINPQIIMWDPATYPDVEKIADLAADNVTIRYFQTGAYMRYLVSAGIVKESQLDGSYDGSPAVFTAQGGKIAQQGFASAEPYTYEKLVPEWNKPVKYQLIHDAGWVGYAAPLAVLKENFDANKACFEKLVPIVQQAQVDYITDPAKTNELIVKAVTEYKDFWVYSPDLANYSVQAQKDLGLVGNGPNSTLGDFDEARLTDFIAKALPVFAAKNPPADLKPSDLTTNEFIDSSIGL
jgi:hypothetical protein